ncbi:MAG: glycosyltransferase family 4 protein [Armatimonadetes bacterium]|nr:glycosyltransferase family 4 protein [Armatimonadota bacterium]MDE2207757.1 glycosyltransferase family 4 protein [Armatimonadota bacterium]
MLTTIGDRCGVAAYTRELTRALDRLPGIEVETIPITVGRQPTEHYVEQAKSLNAGDIDLVHVQHEHSFWGGVMPRASAWWELRYLISKPIVLTAHTTFSLAQLLRLPTERRPHKWLVKRLLIASRRYRDSVDAAPFATAVTIVHTEAARTELIGRGVDPRYVITIPTGVPAATPVPDGGAGFRRRFGLDGKTTLTVFGYIAPNKGYELMFDVLGSLSPEVVLVIAGGARTADMEPYRRRLEQQMHELGLSERVVITGYLSDEEVAAAMEASDLALAPHTEATGSYSVMLPMSHGRPILASDLDCFKEAFGRRPCLQLFRNGDRRDLVLHLRQLLADGPRRAELGREAAAYAADHSWAKTAERTVAVYRRALSTYSPALHQRRRARREEGS